jgi:hypothetical protein
MCMIIIADWLLIGFVVTTYVVEWLSLLPEILLDLFPMLVALVGAETRSPCVDK